jgi:hypothetical protein
MSSFIIEVSATNDAVSAVVTPSVVVEGVSDYEDLQNIPDTFPPDPHNHDERYYTEDEIDDLVANLEGGQGVTDHGALSGREDDDHTQYHNDARGDARYYTQTQLDTSLGGKASTDSVTTVQANLDNHTGDTSDAHDASAISYAGGTGMAATDAEAAIDELANEKANASDLTAHIDDTTDAHDAAAISFAAAGGIVATSVQAALQELDTEKAASSHTHNASAIDAGTMATARLGSGTADGTTYLRGDQTWATVSGGSSYRTLVTLGSDVASTTGGSYSDVTGLSFAVTNGTTYRFYFLMIYTSSATTNGIRLTLNGPAFSLLSYNITANASSAVATLASGACNSYGTVGVGDFVATASYTAGNIATIEGIITPSASGTLQARFAPEVNTNTTTIKAGSTVEYW